MPELPDSGLLVRGAPFGFNSFEAAVKRHYKRNGVYALSVWGGTDSVEAIVQRTREANLDLLGATVRVATAGAVRRAGLQLRNNHTWHHLILFARKPSRADWDTIDQDVFGHTRPAT